MKKQTYKQTSPMVTVLIPVFNGAKYLEEAVHSVFTSTYKNFEVLLVDDGSSDASKHICRMLARQYPQVRFYDFARNRGLGRVLNFALKKARGKYIARLNQDDRMLPHRLATQVRYLERHTDVTVVGSSIVLFDNQGKKQIVHFLPTDEEIKKMWYVVSPFADPTVMYRKAVALTVGGYDQSFWPADDTHLWYRMGMKGKLANLRRPVSQVRWHNGAASVAHFRKLALRTYQMHMWTHKWISPAPWYIHLYWIIQLAAGYLLSPQINWGVYRIMKKLIYLYECLREWAAKKLHATPMVKMVMAHPKKLSLSGV